MRFRLSSWSIVILAIFAAPGNSACDNNQSISSATISCQVPLATLCAASTSGECLPTWSAVLAGNACSTNDDPNSTYTCGSYEVHRIVSVDIYTLSYYDPATGALIAVLYGNNAAPVTCLGGPAAFAASLCSVPLSFGTCPDAGVDGGN
jgi:hypothetical protein